jgi:hypothetical protein
VLQKHRGKRHQPVIQHPGASTQSSNSHRIC